MSHVSFAERVVAWQKTHGRHDLPWQQDPSPYSTWISEIMLQQTQVAVVIDYFNRWMARFPTPTALARAPLNDVLEHWAGLGYYARARNLHRAAIMIAENHHGVVPDDDDALQALPGIGRSTAGAIRSLGFGHVAAILDGNVKRVLARHAGATGWPGRSAVSRRLWEEADRRLPSGNAAAYSQGMMDLGATICRRQNPACERCPVASDCVARQAGTQQHLPGPKPRKARPERRSQLLLLRHERCILMQQRPSPGIWGGLWTPPIIDDEQGAEEALKKLGLGASCAAEYLPTVTHDLTHFRWHLQPMLLDVHPKGVQDDGSYQLFAIDDPSCAMPAPIRRLIAQLADQELDSTH